MCHCLLFFCCAYCNILFRLLTRFTLLIVHCSSLGITITFLTWTNATIIRMIFNITMTITKTIFTLIHYFFGKPFANHLTNLFHGQQIIFHSFLIIFFLLDFVEEVVCVFSTPSTTIFDIPITCLYLPFRNFILHSERRNVPY